MAYAPAFNPDTTDPDTGLGTAPPPPAEVLPLFVPAPAGPVYYGGPWRPPAPSFATPSPSPTVQLGQPAPAFYGGPWRPPAPTIGAPTIAAPAESLMGLGGPLFDPGGTTMPVKFDAPKVFDAIPAEANRPATFTTGKSGWFKRLLAFAFPKKLA